MLVRAKYNIFISGGTNSGKTTFLNALAGFIPRDERIVLIEDSAELRLEGIENLIRMETRNSNSSGAGLVTMRQLIRASLRMRPERIIVGEVRGEEALDMLQAMNTGHDGSLSTGHANSTQDMLARLETMVLMGTSSLPQEAVRRQIASAVDIMIHLSRLRDHSRRVISITEVAGFRKGEIQLNPLFVFEEEPGAGTGERVAGKLTRTKTACCMTISSSCTVCRARYRCELSMTRAAINCSKYDPTLAERLLCSFAGAAAGGFVGYVFYEHIIAVITGAAAGIVYINKLYIKTVPKRSERSCCFSSGICWSRSHPP